MQMPEYKSKGFIYGVGVNHKYLNSAKLSAQSIKDHYPEASITLVAPSQMVDHECHDIFDNVIADGNVPNSARTKLWALAKTPYDLTMYLDADTMCVSSDIKYCWDQIKDNDIMFTLIRLYNSNVKGVVNSPNYKYHGGVFLYNRNCISMMSEWWDRWNKGQVEWKYNYPSRLRDWDQFYLYYIMNYTKHGLKVGIFEDDARWNFVCGYLNSELNGKSKIIEHYTIGRDTPIL